MAGDPEVICVPRAPASRTTRFQGAEGSARISLKESGRKCWSAPAEQTNERLALELCGPVGIGIDTKANLYIADAYNGRIRVVNGAGIINTYVGDGGGGYNGNGLPALSTNMEPFPLAVSPVGIVCYGDIESYLVRKIH